MKFILGLMTIFSLRAEFISVQMTVSGMDCASCVTGLEARLKRLRGVKTVELKPEKNLLSLELLDGNTVRIDRIRDDIKGVGFAPKDAKIRARGRATKEHGIWIFMLEGSNQRFVLSFSESIEKQLSPGQIVTVDALQPLPASPTEDLVLAIQSVSAS